MPQKKRGRPPKTAPPASPTFTPIFSKPKLPSNRPCIQLSDNDVKPDLFLLDLMPPAILGEDAPPAAIAGPSTKVCV
jgi:hypothetical protein